MGKVLAFGASTSRASINKQFATWAVHQMSEVEATVIDLNDYPMPLFSVDVERESGAPATAYTLKELIQAQDGLIISFAEHNGAYSAAFKNVFDWLSRLEGKPWGGKPALLLSTSPGARGGATVLEIAKARFPFSGGEVVATFSLPQFRVNFDATRGISEPSLAKGFQEALQKFEARLK